MMSGEDVAGIKQDLAVLKNTVENEFKQVRRDIQDFTDGKFAHCATQVARIGSLEHRMKHLEAVTEESNREVKGNWQWSWRLVVGVVVTVILSSVTTAIIGTVIAKAVFKN
jgi:transposase-like protein